LEVAWSVGQHALLCDRLEVSEMNE